MGTVFVGFHLRFRQHIIYFHWSSPFQNYLSIFPFLFLKFRIPTIRTLIILFFLPLLSSTLPKSELRAAITTISTSDHSKVTPSKNEEKSPTAALSVTYTLLLGLHKQHTGVVCRRVLDYLFGDSQTTENECQWTYDCMHCSFETYRSLFCSYDCEGFLGPTRFLENQRRLESGDWRPMQPSSAQWSASKFAPPQAWQSHRCEAWPWDAQQLGARWLDQHRAGSPTAERRGGSTSTGLGGCGWQAYGRGTQQWDAYGWEAPGWDGYDSEMDKSYLCKSETFAPEVSDSRAFDPMASHGSKASTD